MVVVAAVVCYADSVWRSQNLTDFLQSPHIVLTVMDKDSLSVRSPSTLRPALLHLPTGGAAHARTFQRTPQMSTSTAHYTLMNENQRSDACLSRAHPRYLHLAAERNIPSRRPPLSPSRIAALSLPTSDVDSSATVFNAECLA